MAQLRTWRNAGEEEDWLRTKGKLLGFLAEVLANSLRMDFPKVPPELQHLVFGYITPVSAEYIRRELWRNATLSQHHQLQLYGYLIRTYGSVIARYRGTISDVGLCMEETVRAPMASHDPSFQTRMQRVIPFFDTHFSSRDAERFQDFDQSFAAAFLVQMAQLLRESGVRLNVSQDEATHLCGVFEATGTTVRKMLSE